MRFQETGGEGGMAETAKNKCVDVYLAKAKSELHTANEKEGK